LSGRFSREDLMRAFDLLAKAEADIRNASHPRYHFEMALLRWMHLRKLVPLMDLIEQLGAGGAGRTGAPAAKAIAPTPAVRTAPPAKGAIAPNREPRVAPRETPAASGDARLAPPDTKTATGAAGALSGPALKDALLAEIRSGKKILYELSIACAQRIDVTDQAVTFTFGANQNAARGNLEQSRTWIEAAAQRLAGRRINIVVAQSQSAAAPGSDGGPVPEPRAVPPSPEPDKPKGGRDLKAEAMSSSAVQAMLDVFPAEIRDVEEM
jgi:DNA polymerase-3 subunit gamma/tau